MPSLLVRELDEGLIQALKERAARNRRSAEAEHRAILAAVLGRPKRLTLAEALARIPPVGRDDDFERRQSDAEAAGVLD
jgi:plasmid stability protein